MQENKDQKNSEYGLFSRSERNSWSPPNIKHEEADTRLNFHAGMSNEAAIIVEKDLDVFLLLIYILGK